MQWVGPYTIKKSQEPGQLPIESIIDSNGMIVYQDTVMNNKKLYAFFDELCELDSSDESNIDIAPLFEKYGFSMFIRLVDNPIAEEGISRKIRAI